MNSLKRVGLYGVSGSGKTTILKKVVSLCAGVLWLEGSKLTVEAAGMTLEEFKMKNDVEKYQIRERAIENAFSIQAQENKHIIIDGHVAFPNKENGFDNIMTGMDGLFYKDYIYLNLSPSVIYQRQQNDNSRKRDFSVATISAWQNFELKALSEFCKRWQTNLQIIEETDNEKCADFICNHLFRRNE